ncbi:putative 3-carboxymuconate cyclase protein [Phaeoacremonium minimum UCRPA7]|uniref:Putative 3-carboxymuconate cyclase protein n=1 Tax=Phaeoacremonium minimum (strain UCR-PA7) TaxID=1286976 RepID=R8BG20_PHAM7|nr:putative 3-carboxymuconate cyclase protein [Phaeoacremonium minimum UCRPA7]EON98232.1 putative 3-carboxymuconate cyclase protein [Phaeoacremonium minimum UCRPA7]
MDALRPFDLQQTTPPLGPTNTVSQVFFSNDDNTLFTTVKGDPTKNNTGFLAAYPVEKNSECEAGFSGKGVIEDQKATCWATVSAVSGTAFVTDVAIDRLVEMSLTDASILGEIDLSANGDPGLIDLKAAGKFLYALSPGNGTTQAAIAVVNVVDKKQVQHFELKDLGADKNAQGLAILL